MDLVEENLDIKIDLSDITEFDSSALQLLYSFSTHLKKKGMDARIIANNGKTDLFMKTYGMEI
jgi:anti-anti-sigma regulatory factor